MKKVIVTLALCLILSGCSNEWGSNAVPPENNTGTKQTTNQTETPKTEEVKKLTFTQFDQPAKGEEIIVMKTSMGDIKLRLFPQFAPKAVENFKTHAKEGYYDGLIFHRVMNDFMIQGGDPLGSGTGGESIWKKPFQDEFNQGILNFRGALSMANSGPNSNGSQFFIVQKTMVEENMLKQLGQIGAPAEVVDAYRAHGGTPWLDGKHTVFGQVFEGMDIVDKIAAVEVGAGDKPKIDVVMEKVTVLEYK